MNHHDHVRLISKGVAEEGGVWADFGSGAGAFTLALRDVAGDTVRIYSVDSDRDSLAQQEILMDERFPATSITYMLADFTGSLTIPQLDGIIMANSLHYVGDQVPFLKKIRAYLKPEGRLVLVEYNADRGNVWVPYPVSYARFQQIAVDAGFKPPTFLDREPSHFLREIYSAVSVK